MFLYNNFTAIHPQVELFGHDQCDGQTNAATHGVLPLALLERILHWCTDSPRSVSLKKKKEKHLCSNERGGWESFTSFIPSLIVPLTEGWSLLCHQTKAQPCHYAAVKVVSGCTAGLSNGKGGHHLWYMIWQEAARVQVKWAAFWQSWKAEYERPFDNRSFEGEKTTCSSPRISHPETINVCQAPYSLGFMEINLE